MGMYKYTHIGPYIEIETVKEVVEVNRKGCPEHGEYKSLFCPMCGRHQEDIVVPQEFYYDWVDELEEIIVDKEVGNKTLLISNGGYCIEIDDEDKTHVIDLSVIDKMVEDFKKEYHEEIKKIEQVVGKPVEVQFGAFVYYQ